MMRYGVRVFGITVFALALIWFAGPGDATQTSSKSEPVLWADTVHINLDENRPAQPETPPGENRNDTFLRNIRKLTQTAFEIRSSYMEDVDPETLVKAGIDGMLSGLDRFSVLMERTAYDQLMESTHGKYEGLGMQIDERDNHILIISPIEGTPAYRKGLRAGDLILEINGKSTDGMASADASKLMRGEAGTSVDLKIKRAGLSEPLDFRVERAVIELKSVNYSGVVPGTTVGYVRLSRFAEETSAELREAIGKLNEQNITGLIFDLRSNGGGLLDQAKETAELFLNQGNEIVYTRGRDQQTERHYRSERPPLFPEKPLVILVDEGTASASEIVAGAIQDWDRGIILGNTTYGKGLVQQIFPINNDGSLALKLTTAKYYVPSGRCIQKPDRQGKDKPGAVHADVEADSAADTLSVKDREVFYTNGGRMVYGGGGIVPDISIDRETWKTIEINLYRQSLFFDFAIDYVAKHPDVKPDMEVSDAMVSEFRQFIKSKKFDYKTELEAAADDLKKTVKDENAETAFEGTIKTLEAEIAVEKDRDFDRSIPYIKKAIQREILASMGGERAVYENVILKTDNAVTQAVKILSSPKEYGRLITGEGQPKKQG